MSVNISQLEYFVTTVQCGSFSMAAKELFVTPQAVSKAVGDLERELRVHLCEKSGRSVKPTKFGRMFSLRASEALSCLADLETLAKTQALTQAQEGSVTLAVACSPFRGNVLHPKDFDAFAKAHPRINLETIFLSSGSCLAALEEGIVDAAVIMGRTTRPDLTCVRMLSSPLHLAVLPSHPLANQELVSAEDLHETVVASAEDIRYCQGVIAGHLHAKGSEPHFENLPPFMEDHRAFLERGGALFVVADPALGNLYPEARILPVSTEDIMPIPLCLAYASETSNKALLPVEHYLLNLAARLRREKR